MPDPLYLNDPPPEGDGSSKSSDGRERIQGATMREEYPRRGHVGRLDDKTNQGPEEDYVPTPAVPNSPQGAEFRGMGYKSKVPRTSGSDPFAGKGSM